MNCSAVSASAAGFCVLPKQKAEYQSNKARPAAQRPRRVLLSASPSFHHRTASLTTPPSPAAPIPPSSPLLRHLSQSRLHYSASRALAPRLTEKACSALCVCVRARTRKELKKMHACAGVDIENAKRGREEEKGLGIVEFLRGKNFLVTGGLGLLGKVLVEKILRVQPNVGQIYLLLRPKDGDLVEERLRQEVLNSELFKPLQEIHGGSFEDFMKSKLTIIEGDISLQNLGICDENMRKILNQIHVVVNSAAATAFDARYDDALLVNARGAQNVIEFSKQLCSLQLVMHVSTAYVNGHKEGFVYEDPLILEEILQVSSNKTHPMASLYVEQEEKAVQEIKMKMDCSLKGLVVSLKDLGMERATQSGSYNTYVFTKALGEILVDETRKDLPVVILRPSIIQSTIMEPFDGWLEGCRMADPLITFYAKGQIHGFVSSNSTIMDMVPLDMVVNAMLAIITKRANKSGLEVYHTASSSINPMSFGDFMKFSYRHLKKSPYIDRNGKVININPFHFHPNVDEFLHDEMQELEYTGGLSSRERIRFLSYLKWMANLYRPYTLLSKCKFDSSKARNLYGELSSHEKKSFNFDVESIDWEHFIKNIHVPGLRKYVHKNRGYNVQ